VKGLTDPVKYAHGEWPKHPNKDPERQIDFFDGTEYDWLSNFYPSVVSIETVDGRSKIQCSTVEHAFQASKTFNIVRREEIAMARTAGIAKHMGKNRKRTELRPDWENVKRDIMKDLLRQKFQLGTNGLGERLLATGEALLIEGNTWGDREWGQCPLGRGRNLLGTLLMEVREELRS
jgi:ribA/ribD-fused uncharacterized protein